MIQEEVLTPNRIQIAFPPEDTADFSAVIRPYLPVLLLLFVGSGCAALIYEVVWFQLLQLAIGSSAVSLGVLLGTYMGGMCVGSLLLFKYVSFRQHPLRVFAKIECGIGVFAILVLWAIPYLDKIYAAVASHGLQGIALRAVFAAVCLIPPTLLMGASLPAMSRNPMPAKSLSMSAGGWKLPPRWRT